MKMKTELPEESTADARSEVNPLETLVMRKVEANSRPTIMNGRVWDFSDKFKVEHGAFGERKVADGCFHISASRDQVIVHWANLKTSDDFKLFEEAIAMAKDEFLALSRMSYA